MGHYYGYGGLIYVKSLWFELVDSGTSGTITPPTDGRVVLDQWAAGVDALASNLDGGIPNYVSPVAADGSIITATLDSSGGWALSGTPTSYPVAIIYVYQTQLVKFDINYSLGGIEFVQNINIANSINAAAAKTTPADADSFGIIDSVSSALKKITWSNIKSTLKTYFDTIYTLVNLGGIAHSLATAANDFLVASGTGAFVKKTLAETLAILGLSTAGSIATGSIELGNVADTTISRVSAGQIAVEGTNVLMNGGALGTPSSGTLSNCTAATTSATGVVELSTPAEGIAQTSTSTVLTPEGAAAAYMIYVSSLQRAPYIYFNGTGTTGNSIINNSNVLFGTNNCGANILASIMSYSANQRLLYTRSGSSGAYYGIHFFLNYSGGWVYPTLYLYRNGNATSVVCATPVDTTKYPLNTSHWWGFDFVREAAGSAGSVQFYIDNLPHGDPISVSAAAVVTISTTAPVYWGGTDTAQTVGGWTTLRLYNYSRSASRWKNTGESDVPYSDRGASQTALTSGTLTVGKLYRIDTYVSGDDFSNVATVISGTINTSGCLFQATGTTPTTWTNSSSLRQVGAICDQSRVMMGQILDRSGNGNHASHPSAGATVINAPEVSTYIWGTAMTDDTTLTNANPAAYTFEKAVFNNSTANQAILDCGTTPGGNDVFTGKTIKASGFTTVYPSENFSTFSLTAAQSFYLNDDTGGSSWNSSSLTVTLFFRRVN